MPSVDWEIGTKDVFTSKKCIHENTGGIACLALISAFQNRHGKSWRNAEGAAGHYLEQEENI